MKFISTTSYIHPNILCNYPEIIWIVICACCEYLCTHKVRISQLVSINFIKPMLAGLLWQKSEVDVNKWANRGNDFYLFPPSKTCR